MLDIIIILIIVCLGWKIWLNNVAAGLYYKMNGQNRPLIKPKRRLVLFIFHPTKLFNFVEPQNGKLFKTSKLRKKTFAVLLAERGHLLRQLQNNGDHIVEEVLVVNIFIADHVI